NGVLSNTQRESLDLEAQALSEEYNRIIETTTFNQLALLNPSLGNLTLQAGIGEDATLSIDLLSDLADKLQPFTQTLSLASLDYVASTLSSVRFLTVKGDDGKDTLIAMGLATNVNNNRLALVIQSYRVDETGEF